jgi:uncharacterized membrane protein
MSIVQGLLIAAVVGAGGFVGVICAMAGVIQWMLNGLPYNEYRLAMQGIIVQGRRSILIWIVLLVPLFAGGGALWTLWGQGQDTAFWFTALGMLIFFIGPVMGSRLLNEPWYDKVMQWQADYAPANWQRERMRWFSFNVVRLTTGLSGCVLLAAALAVVQ